MKARKRAPEPDDLLGGGFLKACFLREEQVPSAHRYPYSIPALRNLGTLRFHPRVTFLVGENGSGKSTLIEAIAVVAGFNPEGGSKAFNFETRRTESELHGVLQLVRGVRREKDGFFLRAESFYNVASEIDALDDERPGLLRSYGGKSLHEQSHGESFMALVLNRFRAEGLYVLDEPESALSPGRQLALLKIIDAHVRRRGSQFIIATHSPLLMAYPDAAIYHLDSDGVRTVEYEETEHYRVTRDFLNSRETFFHHLFRDEEWIE